MLLFIGICLIAFIPHTSIQDQSIRRETPSQSAVRASPSNEIADLIRIFTEKQYQYETASYALALTNILPNFAKFFHERSEEKYHDAKGLIDLSQVLNLDMSLKYISSNPAKQTLQYLSPKELNGTNFVEFFSDLEAHECKTVSTYLNKAYHQTGDMSVPLQMYLKKKLYFKQLLACKVISDLHVQLRRFIQIDSNPRSIPFAMRFLDSRVHHVLKK